MRDSAAIKPRRGLTRALLRWAASANPAHAGGLRLPNQAWDIDDDRQLQHIAQGGLAPLLRYATGDDAATVPTRWHEDLESAELTARFAHAALRESAAQVIDVCGELGVPVTLLKGISIGNQCWPAAHLRPMGDIDILLLPERNCALVESMLRRRGYAPMAGFKTSSEQAHGAPLYDPHRDVWIEPHTSLFQRHERVNGGTLFSPDFVNARSIPSTFDGRPILRLADELQLAYIASYWLSDIRRDGVHSTFLTPLFDAIFLLKSSARSLDWDGLLASLDNEAATASLYVLLVQVQRHGFEEEEVARVLPRLATAQRIVGAAELRAMNLLLDACLVSGRKFMGGFGRRHPMLESSVMDTLLAPHSFARKLLSLPWNFVFPPRVRERYTVRYHIDRLTRLFRRARST